MNVFQYFHLRFETGQQNHQSEVKVFKLSGCRQNVGKCWKMSENDSGLFLTYLRYLNANSDLWLSPYWQEVMYHVRPGNKYQLLNKHVWKFTTLFYKSVTLAAIFNHLHRFFHKSLITKKYWKSTKTGMWKFFFNAKS